MTTSVDTKALAGVVSAMAKVGATASYIQYTGESYDPLTGDVTEGAATTTAVKAIPPFKADRKLRGQTALALEKATSGVAGNALVTPPTVGNEITIGTDKFKVTEVAAIRSGDDVALYVLGLDETR